MIKQHSLRYNGSYNFVCVFSEIPNFLTDAECHQIIHRASNIQVLETSPVDDISNDNIEATSIETFREWDYNSDRVMTPLEVKNFSFLYECNVLLLGNVNTLSSVACRH